MISSVKKRVQIILVFALCYLLLFVGFLLFVVPYEIFVYDVRSVSKPTFAQLYLLPGYLCSFVVLLVLLFMTVGIFEGVRCKGTQSDGVEAVVTSRTYALMVHGNIPPLLRAA